MILYLHGFRSSSLSAKSQQIQQAMAAAGRENELACPDLPDDPQAAIDLALATAKSLCGSGSTRELTVIGSSLGGYYATWLKEELDCKAVVINPAVYAVRDLSTQLGHTEKFHSNAPFSFTAASVRALARLRKPELTRMSRYYLLACTGDELLDWQEMTHRYDGARVTLVQGGDHAFSMFETYLPSILDFTASK